MLIQSLDPVSHAGKGVEDRLHDLIPPLFPFGEPRGGGDEVDLIPWAAIEKGLLLVQRKGGVSTEGREQQQTKELP